MKYTLTNKPQKINETKGEIQNVSVRHVIVLAAGTSIPSVDTSTITVRPGESYPFKTVLGEVLYAWIINANDDETLEVSVINFPSGGEGGDTDISAIETEIINQGKQIQNCYEKPHESLDYVLFVENGELKEWSKDGKSKLQTSQQVGNGDLDTHSLDNKGLNGVIAQDNLHVGKGYKNELKYPFSGYNHTIEDLNNETYKMTFTSDIESSICYIRHSALDDGKLMFCSLELLEVSSNNSTPKFWTTGQGPILTLGYNETINGRVSGSYKYLGFGIDNGSTGDYIIFKKPIVANIQNSVPYIKDSIPDGRCVLDANWTSDDHSFIMKGVKLKSNPNDGVYYLYFCGAINKESCYIGSVSGFVAGDIVDILISKTVNIITRRSDGYERSTTIPNKGVTGSTIAIAGIYDNQDFIEGFYSFGGDLTEQELRDEFNKTKNGKVKLDPMGFVENIPNSKKRMDESGVIKTHLKVTTAEKDEDIYLATEGDMYEIIDSNGVSYVTMGVDGAITPGSKIKNVAGYVVTDDLVATYPLKLRVVK